ncbi:PHB depolymerase family esterase [Massilia sp. Dwa41.01b]|uniref:extracellular catalytic domain type 1 short-chain-length polyhydroxyalkanoate depolymerase n=1 Tax=unclassified Massilia TaxID=2609279 RepID=UPI0015FF6D21|nr:MULTISPECIES: PHB depolymerase family esterase [unclassified Massilia]QNA87405.1 PHB depolymerase family esterase [Massilia sp. Dwa41.01b]QNA98311.1 PHB depolymerase family esterase [Massilia sp. Se16.2.3]
MTFSFFNRTARQAVLLAALAPWAIAQAQVQAGPGTWSGNQTWASDTVNGGALTGYYYWPATAPALGGKRALVLVLHGCSQTAAGDVIDGSSDRGYNWKAAADQYGAVILAPNATGNVYGVHCWDWAKSTHSRSTGHSGVLLDLINRFLSNPQYAIDPKQVYVTGLSSGGAQTMVMGCLAPDVFAGLGINAGPPPGVSTSQIGMVPSGYTATTAANNCRNLAGTNASQFGSQIAGVIWGTNDYTVAQGYGPLDAAAMRIAYGGSYTKGAAVSVPTGGSNIPYTDANGKVRTSEITVTGMGHAWPAGTGGQNGNYVDATKVNYPSFVMDFWFRNNLRVARVAPPTMASCSASVSGSTVTVNGAAGSGTIGSYKVVLNGPTPVNDAAAGSGASFSKAYAGRADGYYSGSVTATDSSTGLTSNACSISQFLVGSAPALQAPAGLAISARSASSISLTWNASNGAVGYNVYRNGSKVNGAAVTATGYTDTGLAASTGYSYQVSALGNGGVESARSASVTASTTGSCTATTSSNYAHVTAGRAHASGGYALANGSNQNMGLNNTFYTTTLAQTAPGYYVIGNCP